ncbi:MAG: alanine--tRNA ligase [Actinomycetales bacterium]|nr:alanine--tRNA ligase [Actinomycetales bacterium]
MQSAQIRQRFLDFFSERGHTAVPSASLLLDDPTLLFVNAGMVPFKPYFLGQAVPPYDRAVSVQKCVRTGDIEEVGKTTRHASFFQMCGNFSFGDYFKESAIPFAWELLTRPVSDGGYGFPESKLWVTVFQNDDEAIDIWHNKVGVPLDRIQRRGMADNYWSMGVAGPCGPCSEIYYDRGPEHGKEGGPVADEDRYLEVWNLVFMQYERADGGTKDDFPILGELPAKNIDTGMGLERMAALLQGVENIYEIDTTMAILNSASGLSGVKYGSDSAKDVALRVVADHSRTCVFMVADGILPGNEGRGYVLRRLMRRVVRSMRLLGTQENVAQVLVDSTIDAMAAQYPELEAARGRINSVLQGEEAAFMQTLATGTRIFESAAVKAKDSGAALLSGTDAFALHDTYGFPIDLTLEMAAERGLQVDRDGFTALMKQQRERAKADAKARKTGLTTVKAYADVMERAGATTFTGYTETTTESNVSGLLRDGAEITSATPGEHVDVVLSRTPFYAEGGGQLGDHGVIDLANGARLEVWDVQTPVPGVYVHRATVIEGEASLGVDAVGHVDTSRRSAISRAHTATHMLHKAFREILGDTATQMGSENSPGRLRFDFPSPQAVPDSVLAEVEHRVNEVLIEDLQVNIETMSQAAARDIGAMALFGEKYGETVRVVSVGEWARELCGGTHAHRSGELGVVKFLSEGSIGAGVRRVEALVGVDAYKHLATEHLLLSRISEMVKARPEELPERIDALLTKVKDLDRELTKFRSAALLSNLDDILAAGIDTSRGKAWVFEAPAGLGADEVRELVMNIRGRAGQAPATVFAASAGEGKVTVVCAATAAAVAAGVSASDLLKAAAPSIDGRGGGKPDLAQGGGTNPAGITAALAAVTAALHG